MRAHLLATATLLALTACSSHPPADAPADDAGVDAVSNRPTPTPVSPLFVGSGGFGYGVGSAFPGASAPQGMAKVGPETSGPWGTINFLHCSGYWYGDDTILGFSHLHLHGTGAQDYGVLAMMPTDAWDASRTNENGYQSTFDKSTESATPGTYSVTLARGSIAVEIAATPHAAHHRYTYPATATAGHVIFDLDHHLSGSVTTETITLDPSSQTLTGSLRSIGSMSGGFGGSMIYFAAQSLQPWSSEVVWSQGVGPTAGTQASGTGVGADIDFDLSQSHAPIEIQIGLSFVSTASALDNLQTEMPSFAFDTEAATTAAAWNEATSAVTFQGGTSNQQTTLDAALYHLFLMPSVLSDVAGTYVGMDDRIYLAQDFNYCSDMSLWDTYRTLNPLYVLIAPERARDTVRSLTAMAKAGGYFPKWPIATGEAGTMIGASAEVVLADAYVKGVTDFDAEGAYQIMRAASLGTTDPPGGRGGMNNALTYMQLGYVPASVGASASWTIEYGQDDVALGALAGALGHTDDATALATRAQGYKNLFDPATGFLWAKNADGSWATGHLEPTVGTDDFDEADAWQSVWGPWYDFDGLAGLFGGNAGFVTKLESFFEQGEQDYEAIDYTNPLSVGAVRKYYWGGNEPDMHSPYLFAMAGRPDLTQKWVRWVEENVYGPGADGIPGNDDAGTMSAWLVFSALGFYPIPATDRYVVGAPMFPQASLQVGGGTFTVSAPTVSETNLYVQSVTLNGAPLATPYLHHADLMAGGSLVFVMGPSPSTWAVTK
jgi:predicted alpha-1,2-mannosidase